MSNDFPIQPDDFADLKAVMTDEDRFMVQHLATCVECNTVDWCDWYRQAVRRVLGDDLAAYVMGEEVKA